MKGTCVGPFFVLYLYQYYSLKNIIMENNSKTKKVKQTIYSQSEKDLMRLYPNLGPVLWETIKNVNLVMKIILVLFFIQALALLFFLSANIV